ncbi:hypothetical protein [Filobacillus milosensis]|uniref:hypothetical protein n=1 Tax=Filobacillus milosensis TaxID=94137 RepID=UPI00129AAA0F|nr:hypothetical protein [Filobacillus milosensis]
MELSKQEDALSVIHDLTPEGAVEWLMDEYGEELKRFIYTYVKNFSASDIK